MEQHGARQLGGKGACSLRGCVILETRVVNRHFWMVRCFFLGGFCCRDPPSCVAGSSRAVGRAQRCPYPWHGPSTLENKHLCCVSPSCQGLSSPMLRCPSQRLLDRIVRRYAEVPDAGSIYMDHLTDRDKLRLLYTLSVNSHPILLQVGTTLPPLETPPHSSLQANPRMRRAPVPTCRAVPALHFGKLPSLHEVSFFYGVGWLRSGRLLQCSLHQPGKLWGDTDAQPLKQIRTQTGYCTSTL